MKKVKDATFTFDELYSMYALSGETAKDFFTDIQTQAIKKTVENTETIEPFEIFNDTYNDYFKRHNIDMRLCLVEYDNPEINAVLLIEYEDILEAFYFIRTTDDKYIMSGYSEELEEKTIAESIERLIREAEKDGDEEEITISYNPNFFYGYFSNDELENIQNIINTKIFL